MADEARVVLERLLSDSNFRVRFEADRRSVLAEYPALSPEEQNAFVAMSVETFVASGSASQRANPATGTSRKMV